MRKEFRLNKFSEVIVTEGGRMTFYNFEECALQLLSSEINRLKKALDFALKQRIK